ncbi:hypothetical protein DFH08DRAFT_743779 [Mycena albidolilacea]|uniref:BTB domain-containing protein n=1 Tax=Mycena albidolilacea TaxID=1033008 RepID=A0AAD7A2R4_9AGAR|nr:hypothetical protein DFH08DRAFT_743779 [Mycena albidolilacea]
MSCPNSDIIDSNPSPFIPTHPFAKAAGADTILRSSDGADFYVHHAILSLVSPVFETMFSLPQAESSPTVPNIDLQEGSATLDRVLRFFYPAAQPNVATLEELQDVIEVLMKYDMQCVIPMAKQHLEKYHSSRPLAVYAIACRYRWKDVAVAAARESLNHALRARLLADAPPDLEGVTAVAYHNLLQYHFRCGEAARSTTAQLRWFSWPTTLDYCRCNKTPVMFADDSYRQAPVWFSQYLTGVCDVLTVIPGSNVRETGTFYTTLWQNKCDRCCQFNFINFVTSQLPAQLKVEIDEIELRF